MEIILTKDFPSLGYIGDQVRVKDGYARNYLIPRGVGVEASSRNGKLLAHRMAGINARKAKLKLEAETLKKSYEGLTLEFMLRAGEKGKMFGSITAKEIEAALKERNFSVDRRQIKIPEAIKRAGEYTVSVKLHSEVTVTIPVKLQSEVQKAASVEAAAEGEKGAKEKTKKSRSKKKSTEEAAAEGPETAATAE